MKKVTQIRARRSLWRVVPIIFATTILTGCLPDDAIRQVFGENVILTSAIAIQTITASVVNGFFGLFGLA
jgi:hypothetical protein